MADNMGMYDSIDRLVDLCDEVIESDPPGLRQKVVTRYMTTFGNSIERETGTRVTAGVNPGMIDITSIEAIRDLLLAHRNRMEYEYMMAKATADQIESTETATAEATVAVDFNQTIKRISSSQGLSPEDLAAVKLALADLRFAAEEKTREASPRRQRTRSTSHPRARGSSPHSPAPSTRSQSCSEPRRAATNQIDGKLKALSVI